jgi:hypothetical protein
MDIYTRQTIAKFLNKHNIKFNFCNDWTIIDIDGITKDQKAIINSHRFYLICENKMLLTYHFYKGGGWFRIFGHGLAWKNTKIHPKFFSERYGYSKHIMIGKWLIKVI